MIRYIERDEAMIGQETLAKARILFIPTTQVEDRRQLKLLIPVGQSYFHWCKHDDGESCIREKIDDSI